MAEWNDERQRNAVDRVGAWLGSPVRSSTLVGAGPDGPVDVRLARVAGADVASLSSEVTDLLWSRSADHLMLHRGGERVPIDSFLRAQPAGVSGVRLLNQPGLVANLEHGLTVQMPDVDRSVPAMRNLASDLQHASRSQVSMSGFVSSGTEGALGQHADDPRLIVVQLAGHKRWVVHASSTPRHRRSHPDPTNHPTTALADRVLEPGDVLFVPQGAFHEVVPTGGLSVAVTISLRPRFGLTSVPELVAGASGEPALLEPLSDISMDALDRVVEAAISQIDASRLRSLVVDAWCRLPLLEPLDVSRRLLGGGSPRLVPTGSYVGVVDRSPGAVAFAVGGLVVEASSELGEVLCDFLLGQAPTEAVGGVADHLLSAGLLAPC